MATLMCWNLSSSFYQMVTSGLLNFNSLSTNWGDDYFYLRQNSGEGEMNLSIKTLNIGIAFVQSY